MSRYLDIIDPEGVRRLARNRKLFLVCLIFFITVSGYPSWKEYRTKAYTIEGSRKLSQYLNMLRTRSIMNKEALEANFIEPDIVDVYQVSTCGPLSKKTKLWSIRISEFATNVGFVQNQPDALKRYCYDPIYGSSIMADGLARGAIVLAHQNDQKMGKKDHFVKIMVLGASANLERE